MPLRRALSLFIITLLSACGTSSAVTHIASDRYQVSYNAGFKNMTWVEIKNQARQEAENYCMAMGRRYARPDITSNHATGLMPKEAIVTFSCDPKPQSSQTNTTNSPNG